MTLRKVLGSTLVLLATTAMADTLEDIEKKIDEAYKKITSYSAKMTIDSKTDSGQGMSFAYQSKGSQEFLRKGGKLYYRYEAQDATTTNMSGKEEKTEAKSLVIGDGEFTWMLREELAGANKGTKTCTKTKATPDTNGFKEMKQMMTLKALPDEKVDGVDCWVVEAKVNMPAGTPPAGRSVMYYRKDSGLASKVVQFDGNDKQVGTTLLTDIKLNAGGDESQYKFTPPAGVTVQDLTKEPAATETGAQPAAEPKTEEPAAEPKAEEPKKDQPKKEEPKQEEPKKDDKKPKLPKLPGKKP
ncbi:hypothetical protein RAS1_04820 [Phycisphaerae bacterium RAS1]|nr:hypothetical protein RAS1_04820 [Phycisphaerae bacterium RAS1]